MTQTKLNKSGKSETGKSAKEIINGFFAGVQDINGMDPDVAKIIQHLWDENNLSSDTLLTAFKNFRTMGTANGEKKD